ncbi:AIR synthase related protein [Clostridium formicaceticum]|uniref:PurM-like N-terminal domain-containing protein n=1 Tax=Clostridium formicaceticum TaxID=1497 RepID=A0AAC9RFJ9_9CLOT|nr:AIR synthase related protein [Clostridium formicaceticum]AOY75459.1 hypothetical protein BJL90_05855 [Clostridium formicaceticum]ARE85744.1 hypothetical protein CLFO_00600 [Clostridium formicaceticum]
MKVKRFRDLTIIDHMVDKLLVIACDSCGAVGNKEKDIVKVMPEIVGYYTTRVALMEVLSVGAEITTVINTLSVEMEPTGTQIIRGIEKLLKEAGIDTICLNGSTEENFKTCQTAMGITIIGEVQKDKIRVNTSQKGDYVVVAGMPKFGNEITGVYHPDICSIKDLQVLLAMKEVREIYPVGSKGILYESQYLAEENHLNFQIADDVSVDIRKSAGPATVVIFTIAPRKLSFLQEKIKTPLQIIGKLI